MASDWSNATDADVNAEIADRLYARAFLPARNDFATSLDAMAGAEATMDGGEWVRYITALYPKGKEYRETGFRDIRSLMSASARQLAVAFLAASANRKENS